MTFARIRRRLRGIAWLTRVLLLLLCTGSARVSWANHLVGTEWQFTSVGGNQYRVRLTVYTDLVGGGGNAVGDPDITIGAFERHPAGRDLLVSTYGLLRTGVRALPGPGPGCRLASVAIQELIYEATIALEPSLYTSPDGYYLAWERCCRNALLVNVEDAENAPLATMLRFPALTNPLLDRQPNGAPRFGPPASAVALCLGEPAQVSFAATDAEGDSLAYALVAPLGGFTSPNSPFLPAPNPGPYPLVAYASGFSATRPLPGQFSLNARTGLLTGIPTQVGTYAVAVVVREYRRRVLIGENRRETEFSIANCPTNSAPSLTLIAPSGPVVVTGPADRCLTVRAADPDVGQTVTVRAVGTPAVTITPSQFTVQLPAASVDIAVCLTECATPGPRVLTLVVSDDGCRRSRPDTLRIPVRVVPAPNAPPVLTRDPFGPDTLVVDAGQEVQFLVTARDPEGGALTLRLRPNGAPDLAPAVAEGVGLVQLSVRWVPPCAAARLLPYALWLGATDVACQNSADSLRVLVRVRSAGPAGAAELPNVITPNGDQLNDCFGLGTGARAAASACADGFREVQIFNRWGRLVFQSADPAFCWDASGVGPGTYFYHVSGTQRSLRGLLTVEQ